jgi:SAM-dependent methyltransferase
MIEDRLVAAKQRVRPGPDLERRIRAFLQGQLGRVLPSNPARGLDWYYDWVVLGDRSLEALDVVGRLRPPGDKPILDLGSGLGTTVLLAHELGLPAIGVEPGGEELELALERAAALELPGEELMFDGLGENLPLGADSVSAVLMHDVLEHVIDWRAVLAECLRVLEPGGVLYLKGPSYAFRFIEPHYRLPWLPLLPKALARRYLSLLGRDTDYFEHVGYRRRGHVLTELRSLDFELSFPRLEKLRDPSAINRTPVRWAVEHLNAAPAPVQRVVALVAEGPLQSVIDVVARKPGPAAAFNS